MDNGQRAHVGELKRPVEKRDVDQTPVKPVSVLAIGTLFRVIHARDERPKQTAFDQHHEAEIEDRQNPEPRQRERAQDHGGIHQRAIEMKPGQIDAENGEQRFGREERQKQ